MFQDTSDKSGHNDTTQVKEIVGKEDLLAIEENFMDKLDDVKEQLGTMKQSMVQLDTMKQSIEQLTNILHELKKNIKHESTV